MVDTSTLVLQYTYMKSRKTYVAELGNVKNPLVKPIEKDVALFIDEYIRTGNATKSVQKLFAPESVYQTSSMVAKLLKNRDVRDVVKLYAHRAVHRVEDLAETARSEKVRLEANQDILNRAGILPPVAPPPPTQALVIVLPTAVAEKNNINATSHGI